MKKIRPRRTKQGDQGQRDAQRLLVNAAVGLRTSYGLKEHRVFLKDISIGGARITTPLRFATGERISLILNLKPTMSLELWGRIVHNQTARSSAQFEYGVQYLQLQAPDVELLNAYVSTLDPSRAGDVQALKSA